jgi:NADH-quinone oxidoreductase subunit C
MITNEIKERIASKLGDALVTVEQHYDFPVYIVKKANIHDVLKTLKEDTDLDFHFLTTMCGIHSPENEGAEFGLMYQLHNMPNNWRIRIRTFMSKNDLDVPTVTDLWASSNWQERQEYDFYGFNFVGHPMLTRILNMDEMNYYPMRREYALEDAWRDDKEDKYFGR